MSCYYQLVIFHDALMSVADSAIFVDVAVLPADADIWETVSRDTTHMSSPAGDIDNDGIQFVNMMTNCDPTSKEIRHFHTRACPCGGRPDFRKNMIKALDIGWAAAL